MAFRTAGRLGLGGGPARIFSPLALGQALVLQEGKGDERHQRVAVQPIPGAPFEVIKAELFFQLLVRLLADPARRDGRGERLEIGIGRFER